LFTHYGSGPGGRAESYLWESGNLTDLGTFEATGMNARLDIVGYGGTPLLDTRAWIWRGGTMYDIGDFGGEAMASGINNQSQVVGWSSTSSGAQHAFIWDEGVLSDLNDLVPNVSGWILSRATAVNDQGQIVGIGDYNGQRAAFLLTPLSSVPAATRASM
jgi:probable HAF family extracellular repeat protein